MKNILLIICLLFSTQIRGQTVNSSCAVSSAIEQLYWHDVPRIAMNWMDNSNSPDKDNPIIPTAQMDSILQALAAVHNSTGISARDTVIDILSITIPYNGYNTLSLRIDTATVWDEAWDQMQTQTGDSTIDSLLDVHQFQLTSVNGILGMYIANFMSPLRINTRALVPIFNQLSGVITTQSNNFYVGEPEKYISYKVENGNRILTYKIGWGDCPSLCLFHRTWEFSVSPNCDVTYLGSNGDALPVVASVGPVSFISVTASPNPFVNKLELQINPQKQATYEVSDMLGRIVAKGLTLDEENILNTNHWKAGMYIIKVTTEERSITLKVIKE